jgi:hypothetical protein
VGDEGQGLAVGAFAGDQRERLVGPAGERVGGPEGGGDLRCPEGDLPRSAEVVASLEDSGRAWEIPAPEVGAVLTRVPRATPTAPADRSLAGPHRR